MPAAFDAAVPLWAEYFAVPRDKLADWKLVGCVIEDKERFVGAGLYPATCPIFRTAIRKARSSGSTISPAAITAATCCCTRARIASCSRWLGGAGPPWYMEGIAELLGTHRWTGGKLTLGIMPATREELPYWGRVKIVKDELEDGRGLSLPQIMQFDNQAHLRQEPYGWCWAAAAFLDRHPLTQTAFRELKSQIARPLARFLAGVRRSARSSSGRPSARTGRCSCRSATTAMTSRAAVVHKPAPAAAGRRRERRRGCRPRLAGERRHRRSRQELRHLCQRAVRSGRSSRKPGRARRAA